MGDEGATRPADARPPLAELLDLAPHPEGGWFRRTWTSGVLVSRPGSDGSQLRPSATAIHYLLTAGEQSRWHQVDSDELWLHHRGAALDLWLGGTGNEPGAVTSVVLGPELESGQQAQVLVPAGTWQAAGPATDDVLVTCVVSPGFDFADWRLATPLTSRERSPIPNREVPGSGTATSRERSALSGGDGVGSAAGSGPA